MGLGQPVNAKTSNRRMNFFSNEATILVTPNVTRDKTFSKYFL